MAIRPFLAMTAAEIRNCTQLPPRIAWMACHFSPYGKGLSNLPAFLPEGALLMVDDITPIHGHDPELITRQLSDCRDALNLSGILLDFQRPESTETSELVKYLSEALPCPPVVSQVYADTADLPVLICPTAPSVSLQEHLQPWMGREIWLELGCWGEVLTLTEEGCKSASLPLSEIPEAGFSDEILHCHYRITETENAAAFTLWRTEADLTSLLTEAKLLGVGNAIGLYQEFPDFSL